MKRMITRAAMAAVFGVAVLSPTQGKAADDLNVVVTIKPVHALAAAVMEGAGTPKLLLQGASSPHSYTLKPSDARSLNNAKIVVRVSENLETFLEKPLKSLSHKANIVTLAETAGLKLLPVREGGAFEAHEHDSEHGHKHGEKHADTKKHSHDHEKKGNKKAEHAHGEHSHDAKAAEAEHDHEHEGADAHLWLDPANATIIVDRLAEEFAKSAPDRAELFKTNAEKVKQRLDALDAELKQKLAPIQGKPFIVFHDAYQYFEDRYGLTAAGSITVSAERQPGAARLKKIRAKIAETRSVCVFSEPQFEPKLVKTIIEGTNSKTAELDPLGAALAEGPDQYFELMQGLAASLNACLGASS